MDLTAYSTSQVSADGLRSAARFVPPAAHAQILSPTFGSPAAYFEMQKQLASFISTGGGAIVVSDESTMVPEVQMDAQAIANLTERKSSKSVKEKRSPGLISQRGSVSRLENVKTGNLADSLE
jgi:hypothetical protein